MSEKEQAENLRFSIPHLGCRTWKHLKIHHKNKEKTKRDQTEDLLLSEHFRIFHRWKWCWCLEEVMSGDDADDIM